MDYYDNIKAYVQGALNEAEKQSFEVAMQTDAALKDAVEKAQETAFIDLLIHQKIKENIQQSRQNTTVVTTPKLKTEAKAKRKSIYPWLAVAASIALLLFAYFWPTPSPGYLDYAPMTHKSVTTEPVINKAINTWLTGDYLAAKQLFASIQSADELTQLEIDIWLAASEFRSKNYDIAAEKYNAILATSPNLLEQINQRYPKETLTFNFLLAQYRAKQIDKTTFVKSATTLLETYDLEKLKQLEEIE